jgi:hypothetical protein
MEMIVQSSGLKNASVMRTLRITISIAVVALTAAATAQKAPFMEYQVHERNNGVFLVNTDYHLDNSRLEAMVSNISSWFSPRGSQHYIELPEVSMNFHFDQAEVVYETGPALETWMASSFDESMSEEMVTLEEWMASPFENSVEEEVMTVESWMTVPFESALSEEPLILESWMTVPFENTLSEEPLILEGWMTVPFTVHES